MEAGDRETIRRFWLRGLAQKVDCRKDVRLDQSQSPPGSRLRALRYDCRRLRPPRHDPHYAQATCCKRLVMNPNFPDGLLEKTRNMWSTRNGICASLSAHPTQYKSTKSPPTSIAEETPGRIFPSTMRRIAMCAASKSYPLDVTFID